ncbi:MAG TPA: oligopeptidase B, partial [Ornithinibacter sp.]|nr:oligopeptidase B [Ornithinibacter sp.]
MPSPTPPTAERRPHVREHHGHRFEDPYAWMRDTDDPALLAHLEAENAYAEARTAHLAPLRTAIFDEIRSRVKETDLSVPVASGPWWYYARTVEGRQYASQVRSPLTDPSRRPDPEADTVAGEQVVVDGNVEAGDSEFFSLGALTVSADHRLVAFAVDTTGDERFDLTVRVIESGEVLDTSVTGIGYGCELSRDGRFVFYTRLDEAWRPHQLWRHRVGGDPAQDVLIHQEDDERFWMGVSSSRDERWLILGLGSKTTSEVHLLDNDDPEGQWRVVAPRRDGVEYDVEPAGDRLLVVHNTDTPDADLAWAPLDATSHEQWVPWLRSGPGERFVGVDAFDAASVLSLRADGLTALRVLPRDPSSPSGHGEAWDVPVDQGVHSIGLGDNPEPGQTALQVVVESWATPRTVLDIDLGSRHRTVLKRMPVLGDVDLGNYTEQR